MIEEPFNQFYDSSFQELKQVFTKCWKLSKLCNKLRMGRVVTHFTCDDVFASGHWDTIATVLCLNKNPTFYSMSIV